MKLRWCLAFLLAWVMPITRPIPVSAQAPSSPSLDSLQRTLLSASTDSAVGQALEAALFAVQASNRFADSLLILATTARDVRVVAFASLALIPYHEPRTVGPMIHRALLPETNATQRFYLLNASAYILGIGDALVLGQGGDLDSATIRTAQGLRDIGDSAVRNGLGMEHARRLRELGDADSATKAGDDYGLALWHASAYLLCTLDLRSERLLDGFLSPRDREVFANVAEALALSSGEDVIAPLRDRKDIPPAEEQAAAARAKNWWRTYFNNHPDGDWRPAAWATLTRAGYRPAAGRDTTGGIAKPLLAATRSRDRLVRYAAYRLLNDQYGATFDLDPVFCGGKYAMSFRDPEGREDANDNGLRTFWEKHLAQTRAR